MLKDVVADSTNNVDLTCPLLSRNFFITIHNAPDYDAKRCTRHEWCFERKLTITKLARGLHLHQLSYHTSRQNSQTIVPACTHSEVLLSRFC